jgi:hypothetical protein
MTNEKTSFPVEERKFKRRLTQMKTIVQLRFSESELWKETTEVKTVSKNGADFDLSRGCPVGMLVMLLMPMPVGLRLYDHDEELYPVVALVQHCCEFKNGGGNRYHVGVSFIGKDIPETYKTNPLQSYRISGANGDGMWNVVATERPFVVRKHRRVWHKIEVAATLIHREKRAIEKENVQTRDISEGGASVWSSLDAKVGDRVKFACKLHNFYSIAVVRNVVVNTDAQNTIHLEFIDARFPVWNLVGTDQPQPEVVYDIPEDESESWEIEYGGNSAEGEAGTA